MTLKKASIVLGLAAVMVAGVLLSGAVCSVGQMEQEQATLALIKEYEARLTDLGTEIRELKENRAWLALKINEVKQLGKPVPVSLYNSLDYKAKRIQGLEQSVRKISDYLETIRKRLPAKTAVSKIEDALAPGAGDEKSADSRSSLEEEIAAQGLLEWFKLYHGSSGEIVLKTTLPILFPSGSAAVAESYHPFLKEVAEFVKTRKAWIVVDGYADPDPIKTKKYPSNFELGAVRAANIVHSLVDLGADPSMFKLASTGKYRFPDARPMTDNKSMERYVNLTLEFD